MNVRPPLWFRDLLRWLWAPLLSLAFAVALPAAQPAAYRLDQSRILDVPPWILRGVLAVESSSYYAGGRIVYVVRGDGAAGEVGAFQLKRAALKDVGLLAHRSEIRRDPAFAEFAAILYLRHCYRLAGSWRRAVAIYHTGPDGDEDEGADYYRRVCAAGERTL